MTILTIVTRYLTINKIVKMAVIRENMVELGQAEIRLVGCLTSVCDSGFQCVVLVYHQNRFIRKSHLVGFLLEACELGRCLSFLEFDSRLHRYVCGKA